MQISAAPFTITPHNSRACEQAATPWSVM